MRLAAEETIVNIITHAYQGQSNENIKIECEVDDPGLRIVFHEKGIPFFPDEEPGYVTPSPESSDTLHGLGLLLVRKFTDEVIYHNMGRAGKETVLVKYYQEKKANEQLRPAIFDDSTRTEKQSDGTNAPVEVIIRDLDPADTSKLSRIAFYTYGYTYAEFIYHPEQIVRKNLCGEIHSIVAVTAKGELIGHMALEFALKNSPIAEIGCAFVSPKARNSGAANKMSRHLVEMASDLHLKGVYARSVTSHTISQKISVKELGFKECALMVGSLWTLNFRGISVDDQWQKQKESAMITFRPLNKDSNPSIVYLPARHREIIEKTYGNLKLSINARIPSGFPPEPETAVTRLTISIDKLPNAAEIRLFQLGRDAIKVIRSTLRKLCFDKVDAVFIYFDLTDPYVSLSLQEFENMGFFYAGILPFGLQGKDALIMQYMNNLKIDYGEIHTYSPWGQEILHYAANNDPNLL